MPRTSRRTDPPESDSAYATLAALAPDGPPGVALTELLQSLVAATDATGARLWRGLPGGFGTQLSWPPSSDVVPEVVRLADLEARPDVTASARIHDGTRERGAITIDVPGGRLLPADGRQRLQDTANCVLLVWRLDELRTGLDRQQRHTDRLAVELADAPRRLATVRERERRRVASEIIMLSTGRLGRLREQLTRLDADLDRPGPTDGAAAGELRELLEELIEDFRVMVRGIHPLVLRSRGPRAALAEAAAGLSRPTRISGTVPARIDQELGAALYHLTATALQTLARTDRDGDLLEAHLSHVGGLLEVLVTGRARISTAALRAALTVDTDRLAAIGGGVEVGVGASDDDEVTVRAWAPDRLEPEAIAPREAGASLPTRVRSLALALAAQYGPGPGAEPARRLVSRLDGPVRLAVHGFPESAERTAWLAALGRRLPDLNLVPDGRGPDDPPDVVLRPAAERPDQRVDVALVDSGVLIRSAPWSELPDLLTTEVLARADLLRARSVLAALIGLLRGAPSTPPTAAGARLGYELEEVQTRAFELAELEALAELRTGLLDLTRAQLRTAERLLGGRGAAAHVRLGLPASASPGELHQATLEQMRPWRRLAETATVGRRQRESCAVIVRSCEALLAGVRDCL
jgi:hypothetical protein